MTGLNESLIVITIEILADRSVLCEVTVNNATTEDNYEIDSVIQDAVTEIIWKPYDGLTPKFSETKWKTPSDSTRLTIRIDWLPEATAKLHSSIMAAVKDAIISYVDAKAKYYYSELVVILHFNGIAKRSDVWTYDPDEDSWSQNHRSIPPRLHNLSRT